MATSTCQSTIECNNTYHTGNQRKPTMNRKCGRTKWRRSLSKHLILLTIESGPRVLHLNPFNSSLQKQRILLQLVSVNCRQNGNETKRHHKIEPAFSFNACTHGSIHVIIQQVNEFNCRFLFCLPDAFINAILFWEEERWLANVNNCCNGDAVSLVWLKCCDHRAPHTK